MDRGTAVMLTALAGGLVALQAPINSMLGRSMGTFQAVLVNFLIGTALLIAIVAFARGGLGQIREAGGVSWVYFTGGVLGVIYVSSVLVTVRTLGVGGITAATIAGQLAMAVVVDHFGWLGVERDPIDVTKIAGVGFLAAGVWLIVRE